MDNNEEQSRLKTHKQRVICIKQWNINYFFRIIDQELEDFLEHDKCFKLADNYLIAMVFTYFLRASLRPKEYTQFNFFVALYLAHDMEEDEEDTRVELHAWANLANCQNLSPTSFIQHRDKLFRRMEHRGAVSRLCCDILMRSLRPFHKIWLRERHVNHSGAASRYNRKRDRCPKCIKIDSVSQSSTSSSECSPRMVRTTKVRQSTTNYGPSKRLKTEPYKFT